MLRITSYNVCYTKLLRFVLMISTVAGSLTNVSIAEAIVIPENTYLVNYDWGSEVSGDVICQSVITSYSIHYTKLYEHVPTQYCIRLLKQLKRIILMYMNTLNTFLKKCRTMII